MSAIAMQPPEMAMQPPLGQSPAGQSADLSALRIAFVSGNYNCVRDGANRAQNELVRYLIAHGATVRVYSPTCENPAFEPAGDLVSIPSLPMALGRKEYRISLHLPRSTREDIEAFAPNVFHISLPFFHGKSALALARRMNVPAVAAMHTRFESYPRYYGLGFLEGAILARLRKFYRACERIVAPCEAAAQTMEAQGMGHGIGVWSRGVDATIFSPTRRDMAWRRSHGIGDQELVVAFLGRLVLEKGLGDFAKAIQRLRAMGTPFRTLIIGDGPARDHFAAELGEETVFVGFQHGEDLGRALASADVLLNPSVTEAFSNISLEAMACGLPVVAADAPGNNTIVKHGETGMTVPADDIDAYARALQQYLTNPALRAAHGQAARIRSGLFTWDRANNAMVQSYFAAIASAPDGAAAAPVTG
jgi:glycosyltransferase involved in cell wall biosynthesis